jgi:hypothetical protein
VRAQEQHGAGVGKRYGRPADKQDSAAVGKQQDAPAGTEQDAPGGNPEDAPAADDDTGPAAGTQAGAHAEQSRGRGADEPEGPAADKQHGGPDDQGDAATSRADAPAADPGDDETESRDTDEPGDARAHDGTGTADAGAPADAEPAPAAPAFTPTLPLPSLVLTAPLPGVPPNSGHAALHVLPKTSSRKFEAVALSSETPGSLVRSWLRSAVRASVPFEPAELSVAPEQRAMSSARAAHENSVTRDPSDLRLPGVPGAPDNSGCVSSTSCATANPLAIVPLLGALGCLCALLFERLLDPMHPWRLQGVLSLHERPG